MITYMLVTGRHPIYRQGETIASYIQKLNQSNWEFTEEFTELAKDFFLRLVKIDPLERYTGEEALQHPWITRTPTTIPLSYTERGSYQHSEQTLITVYLLIEIDVYILFVLSINKE